MDDGFEFLGHRIVRKRGPTGRKRPVTMIPRSRYQRLAARLSAQLTTDYRQNRLAVIDHLNRQLQGWSQFYQYTDYTGTVYDRVDHLVFWLLARWMARKYRTTIPRVLQQHVRAPKPGAVKTWVVSGQWPDGSGGTVVLRRLSSSPKRHFLWRNLPYNPYLQRDAALPPLLTSHYRDVAFAVQH